MMNKEDDDHDDHCQGYHDDDKSDQNEVPDRHSGWFVLCCTQYYFLNWFDCMVIDDNNEWAMNYDNYDEKNNNDYREYRKLKITGFILSALLKDGRIHKGGSHWMSHLL